MCPSMKISQQRIHSPKGRVTLMREWVRLQVKQGVNLALFAEILIVINSLGRKK